MSGYLNNHLGLSNHGTNYTTIEVLIYTITFGENSFFFLHKHINVGELPS